MGHFLPLFDRSVAGNRVRNRNVSKPNLSQGHSAFSKTERPFCPPAPQHDAAATTLHCRDPVGHVGSVFLQTWCWEENSGQKFNLGFNRPKTGLGFSQSEKDQLLFVHSDWWIAAVMVGVSDFSLIYRQDFWSSAWVTIWLLILSFIESIFPKCLVWLESQIWEVSWLFHDSDGGYSGLETFLSSALLCLQVYSWAVATGCKLCVVSVHIVIVCFISCILIPIHKAYSWHYHYCPVSDLRLSLDLLKIVGTDFKIRLIYLNQSIVWPSKQIALPARHQTTISLGFCFSLCFTCTSRLFHAACVF